MDLHFTFTLRFLMLEFCGHLHNVHFDFGNKTCTFPTE